jgi:hypothetical protein
LNRGALTPARIPKPVAMVPFSFARLTPPIARFGVPVA